MRLRLQTAPAAQPLSLAEAKAHLRETSSSQDSQITDFIAAAIAHLDGKDGWLGRALCTQTWDLMLDAFPTCSGEIEIPMPPLQTITSITYTDTAGATQTLSTSVYAVDVASEPGVVSLKNGQSWPATRSERNAVTIRFVAGYGVAAAVPANVKHALKLLVEDLHCNRGTWIDGGMENPTVENLLFPLRVVVP